MLKICNIIFYSRREKKRKEKKTVTAFETRLLLTVRKCFVSVVFLFSCGWANLLTNKPCLHKTILTQTTREARAKQYEHKNLTGQDDGSTLSNGKWTSHLITPDLQRESKLSSISFSAVTIYRLKVNPVTKMEVLSHLLTNILLQPSITRGMSTMLSSSYCVNSTIIPHLGW